MLNEWCPKYVSVFRYTGIDIYKHYTHYICRVYIYENIQSVYRYIGIQVSIHLNTIYVEYIYDDILSVYRYIGISVYKYRYNYYHICIEYTYRKISIYENIP